MKNSSSLMFMQQLIACSHIGFENDRHSDIVNKHKCSILFGGADFYCSMQRFVILSFHQL